MSLQSKQGLWKKLAKKKYRDAFVASRIAQTIAFQVRLLRQRSDLSQVDLAKELGTSQNAISRLENPKYGKPSISTLRNIASYFDVGLVVRFASLSEIVDWTTDLSESSVDVPDFEHDIEPSERKPTHLNQETPVDQRETTEVAETFIGRTTLVPLWQQQISEVTSISYIAIGSERQTSERGTGDRTIVNMRSDVEPTIPRMPIRYAYLERVDAVSQRRATR